MVGLRILYLLIFLCGFGGCATRSVVAEAEGYNDLFLGTVATDGMGSGSIILKSTNSAVTCKGTSTVTYFPGTWGCAGQSGKFTLNCSDGRKVKGDFDVESCKTGSGEGKDQEGRRFTFAFGMSDSEANKIIKAKSDEVKDLPSLPKPNRQHSTMNASEKMDIQLNHSEPNEIGEFQLFIKSSNVIISLQINEQDFEIVKDRNQSIKLVAVAGKNTEFRVVAKDNVGNLYSKNISVSRKVKKSKSIYAALNPTKVTKQPEKDAVAVVIGIADYRSLPKAEYANDDARAFYDYAIRALGVKPENIKLLVDSDAEEAEILKTFRTWVPSRVKSTTDVYVYYSGHGLPTQDGQGLYLLPPRADREVIDDTAIPFSKINAALQLAKARSVTIFMDACYSGQARSGETLVASARPISLRTENRLFPDGFTVITASQHDQISSSSPDLQHGIFSYYLMRGMEGDADANKDGKITLGEMQAYLAENVGRQAAMMSRKQEPQLIGDANRVLVGR